MLGSASTELGLERTDWHAAGGAAGDHSQAIKMDETSLKLIAPLPCDCSEGNKALVALALRDKAELEARNKEVRPRALTCLIR